jgi:hypothetical protein
MLLCARGDSTLHNKLPYKKAVFRIQAGAEPESNPDPDPDQGFFMIKIIFFDKKNVIYVFLNPYKGHSAPREASSP